MLIQGPISPENRHPFITNFMTAALAWYSSVLFVRWNWRSFKPVSSLILPRLMKTVYRGLWSTCRYINLVHFCCRVTSPDFLSVFVDDRHDKLHYEEGAWGPEHTWEEWKSTWLVELNVIWKLATLMKDLEVSAACSERACGWVRSFKPETKTNKQISQWWDRPRVLSKATCSTKSRTV